MLRPTTTCTRGNPRSEGHEKLSSQFLVGRGILKVKGKKGEGMHPSFFNKVFRVTLGNPPQQKAALIGNDAVPCVVFNEQLWAGGRMTDNLTTFQSSTTGDCHPTSSRDR